MKTEEKLTKVQVVSIRLKGMPKTNWRPAISVGKSNDDVSWNVIVLDGNVVDNDKIAEIDEMPHEGCFVLVTEELA